ncbi:hypothetical protein RI367_007799 [Sorochytrium milnesiophthora]
MSYIRARRNAVCFHEGDAELDRIRALVAGMRSSTSPIEPATPAYASDIDSVYDSDVCSSDSDSESSLSAATASASAASISSMLCRTQLAASDASRVPTVLA